MLVVLSPLRSFLFFSIIICHRSRFQIKRAALLTPVDHFLCGGGALRYLVPKWLPFFDLYGEWLTPPAYFILSFPTFCLTAWECVVLPMDATSCYK